MSSDAPITADAGKPPRKPWFTFTDEGCLTGVRVGGLLVVAGAFLWQFLGPFWAASFLLLPGLILLAAGIPMQAIQGRRGRPGFPWKLGIGLTLLAVALIPDTFYRVQPGGTLKLQITTCYLLATGLWILLWWPLSRPRSRAGTETSA